jgi:hypothetical protein
MNPPVLKVMFYVGRVLITAQLKMKGKRAFAVLYESEPRHTNIIARTEPIELDVECLEKMNPALGADYFYRSKVESPEAAKPANANIEIS